MSSCPGSIGKNAPVGKNALLAMTAMNDPSCTPPADAELKRANAALFDEAERLARLGCRIAVARGYGGLYMHELSGPTQRVYGAKKVHFDAYIDREGTCQWVIVEARKRAKNHNKNRKA